MISIENVHGKFKERFMRKPSSVSPDTAQVKSAQLDKYCQVITLFDKTAKRHAQVRQMQIQGTHDLLDFKTKVVTALDDYYQIYGDCDKEKEFERQWGQEGEEIARVYRGLKPQLDAIHKNTVDNAASYTLPWKVITGGKSVLAMARTSYEEQRENMLVSAGKHPKTFDKFKQSLATHALGSLATKAALVTSGTVGLTTHMMHGSLDTSKAIALGISYPILYGLAALNAEGRMRTLEHEKIQTSSNYLSTIGYEIADSLFSDNKFAKRLAVYAGSLQGMLMEEPAMAAALQIPDIGPTIVFTRAAALIGTNVSQRVVEEIWIRKKNRDKDTKS